MKITEKQLRQFIKEELDGPEAKTLEISEQEAAFIIMCFDGYHNNLDEQETEIGWDLQYRLESLFPGLKL